MGKYYKIKRSSNAKKDNAWKWFSKYIRTRDAIRTTGDIYYCRCITCNEIKPIEEIDAGHAIPGRMNAILFHEELTNGQCRRCNREGGGELQMYKHKMIEQYGQELWDYWQSTKNNIVKYSDFDYEQIAKKYREKVNELKRRV